jgi:hypothetical protein
MKAKFIKPLHYRGEDAKMVGDQEPVWPAFKEQECWTKHYRTKMIGEAFNWYTSTQSNKTASTWVAQWLDRMDKRKDLAQIIRKSDNVPSTIGWLCRINMMGLTLTLSETKKIYNALGKIVLEKSKEAEAKKLVVPKPKGPSIQDRINEKIRECAGEISFQFDEFVAGNFESEPSVVGLLVRYNIPQIRVKELANRLEKQALEFKLATTNTDDQLTEAYSNFGKRQINKMVDWLNTAQEQIYSYGAMKASHRKPSIKKNTSPQKMVGKIKYIRTYEEFGIESFDPVQILKSSEVWVYNVKKRKLGLYVTDSTQSAFYVKGSKILGYNEISSVCKTLRKPKEQLEKLMSLGKPASIKWFNEIKSVETKMNGRITSEMVLLKNYK